MWRFEFLLLFRLKCCLYRNLSIFGRNSDFSWPFWFLSMQNLLEGESWHMPRLIRLREVDCENFLFHQFRFFSNFEVNLLTLNTQEQLIVVFSTFHLEFDHTSTQFNWFYFFLPQFALFSLLLFIFFLQYLQFALLSARPFLCFKTI